jgi:hypothetical protein
MQNIYQDLFEVNRVDWQGPSTFKTRKGKEKQILTGIPKKTFWTFYKRQKSALKEAGLSLRIADTRTVVSGKRARTVKDWELVVWLNKSNRAIFEMHGLTTANNQPF